MVSGGSRTTVPFLHEPSSTPSGHCRDGTFSVATTVRRPLVAIGAPQRNSNGTLRITKSGDAEMTVLAIRSADKAEAHIYQTAAPRVAVWTGGAYAYARGPTGAIAVELRRSLSLSLSLLHRGQLCARSARQTAARHIPHSSAAAVRQQKIEKMRVSDVNLGCS